MNYIYTHKGTGRKYLLDPMITQPNKVCVIDLINGENKFTSPKTLKRWYSKEETNYMYATVRAFTGMMIGMYPVELYPEHPELGTIITKAGKALTFNLDTGVQLNAKNPKFANKINLIYTYSKQGLEWALS